MNLKDYRAIKIKNGSTLILSNKNFDVVFKALKVTEDISEIPVTKEMLDNAQILSSYKPIEIPETPDFDYIK